jgi:hypothetical protein
MPSTPRPTRAEGKDHCSPTQLGLEDALDANPQWYKLTWQFQTVLLKLAQYLLTANTPTTHALVLRSPVCSGTGVHHVLRAASRDHEGRGPRRARRR